MYHEVFDVNNNKLCDCSFYGLKPNNGYAIEYYCHGKKLVHQYIGEFKASKRHGYGKEIYQGKVIVEGEFIDNILINGNKFGLEIRENGELFKYDERYHLRDFEECSKDDLDISNKVFYADFEVINKQHKRISEIKQINEVNTFKKIAKGFIDIANSFNEAKEKLASNIVNINKF